MKKKGFAVLILAALMTLGTAGVSAMAAEGWVQENSGWAYYNAAGNRLSNVWRQGGDGYWRYVNSSGFMAIKSWVDNDDYYVDENGIMVSGKWLQVANSNSNSGYDWYYFNTTGKAAKSKWEKIGEKWYYFDDMGVMQTGWVLDDMYYCGTDGVMATGWQKLPPPDEDYDQDTSNAPFTEEDDGKYWYYFSTTGKKTVPDSDGDNIKQKKINGVYYCLDETGAMQTGWTCVTGDDSDNIEDYRYMDSNGQMRVGWYSAEPPSDLQSHYENDVEWFYFSSKGIPKTGPSKGSAKSSDLVKINGNTYMFNEYGTPVYGLQQVYINGDESAYTAYYFGTKQQSCLMTGKQRVDEGGTSVQYYFSTTGRGYTGVHDNYLYYMGKLQEADSGSKYEVISIPDGNSYKNYVVNTSGKIAKSTTVKDSAGTKYKTNGTGILLKEDDEEVAGGVYRNPEEPDFDANN